MIDDDKVDVFSIKRALDKKGFDGEFDSMSSGQKFLDARSTLENKPDLILMDMNMPGVDGFDVVKVIKSDQAWRSVPVVMLTTSDLSVDRQRSIEVGASDFITKPSSSTEMNTVIDRISEYVVITK